MKEDNSEKIKYSPDFIDIKRFENDLEQLLERFPENVPDHVCEHALGLSQEEAEALYKSIVEKLQKALNVVL